jgi:mono/diheme cytochrome c family protein
VAFGESLYAEHCASCHGAELEGQSSWRTPLPDGRYPAPPHDATGHTWHHDDAYFFETTKYGGQARARQSFVSGMPAFGDELTDDEIWAVLAFIKSRWPEEIRARQARTRR